MAVPKSGLGLGLGLGLGIMVRNTVSEFGTAVYRITLLCRRHGPIPARWPIETVLASISMTGSANSQTGQVADGTSRRLDTSRSGQLVIRQVAD